MQLVAGERRLHSFSRGSDPANNYCLELSQMRQNFHKGLCKNNRVIEETVKQNLDSEWVFPDNFIIMDEKDNNEMVTENGVDEVDSIDVQHLETISDYKNYAKGSMDIAYLLFTVEKQSMWYLCIWK